MLKSLLIGIGNAGNQIANLGAKNQIPAIAINSSSTDLSNVSDDVKKYLIGNGNGAGKDRSNAKKYLKESLRAVVEDKHFSDTVSDSDVIFVCYSIGGGTGSGTSPMFTEIVSSMFDDKIIISVMIFPDIQDSIGALQNAIDALKEVKTQVTNPIYMMYDNTSKDGINTLGKVNQSIINDIKTISGSPLYNTNIDSIDEEDMKKIISTTGRIVVNSLSNIKEKDGDPENNLLSKILSPDSTNVELEMDGVIKRRALITNMSLKMTDYIDVNLCSVTKKLGTPIETFRHIYINEDEKASNDIYCIMSGLSFPDDKIKKMITELEEGMEKFNASSSSILEEESVDTSNIQSIRNSEKKSIDQVNIPDLFSRFGV